MAITELERQRFRKGWSQFDLARESGVHPTTISQIENRRLRPGEPRLRRLAKALGWPEDQAELLTEDADQSLRSYEATNAAP